MTFRHLMGSRPRTLEGKRVKLFPLEAAHSEELWETAKDELLWEHYTFRKMGGGGEFTFTIRVFFKTDSNSKRSQKALEKIGAKHEGTLRNHMIRDDGTYRHSVYYSIIEDEWESVKKTLTAKIA